MPRNATFEITGETFNSWTVLKREPNNAKYGTMWLSRCTCGTEKVIEGRSLRYGYSKSCGCMKTPLFKVGIPLQPFIDAYNRSGLSESEVAKRAGHIRGNGCGDGTWLARCFGRRPYSGSTSCKKSGLIHPKTGLELCEALDIAPVDVGL